MNLSHLRKLGVGTFTAGAIAAGAAQPTPITVQNFSFEQSTGGDPLPDWSGSGYFIDVNSGFPGSTLPSPADGTNYLTFAYGARGPITQTVGNVDAAGATYTLTVAVGLACRTRG